MTKIPHLKLIVQAIEKQDDGSTHFGLNNDPITGGTHCAAFNSDPEAIKVLTGDPFDCFVVYRLDEGRPVLIHSTS